VYALSGAKVRKDWGLEMKEHRKKDKNSINAKKNNL